MNARAIVRFSKTPVSEGRTTQPREENHDHYDHADAHMGRD